VGVFSEHSVVGLIEPRIMQMHRYHYFWLLQLEMCATRSVQSKIVEPEVV